MYVKLIEVIHVLIEEMLNNFERKELRAEESENVKLYNGLKVLQTISYKGPTSIKYWM